MKHTIELIGNTPLYQIEDTNIYVKLEKFNVGGSVKDRAVLGMLQDAIKKRSSYFRKCINRGNKWKYGDCLSYAWCCI